MGLHSHLQELPVAATVCHHNSLHTILQTRPPSRLYFARRQSDRPGNSPDAYTNAERETPIQLTISILLHSPSRRRPCLLPQALATFVPYFARPRKSPLSRLPPVQRKRRLRRNLTINYLVVASRRISEHATVSAWR